MMRCHNPNATKYWQYGARGIAVCPEWHTFQGFYADMGLRPDGKTLDRIDGTKGYCKENCRWATPSEQQRNTKSNRRYTFRGKSLLLQEIAERLGVKPATLFYRIKQGWPEELWGSRPSGVPAVMR
jgi:hypothetical protein